MGGNLTQRSKWDPTDSKTNRTMVWDNDCRMVDDPEAEARKILLAWSPDCERVAV